MSKVSLNKEMLRIVSSALEELSDEMVFVGGAVTALYIDDLGAPEPNPSEDIDCVVQIYSYKDYIELENKLRLKKFVDNDNTSIDSTHLTCRKYYCGIKVDFMPVDSKVLGFSNPWFEKSEPGTKLKLNHMPWYNVNLDIM